jgi:hypothetical protein
MGMLGENPHQLIGPIFIHLRSGCPDHHPFGYRCVAGTDQPFYPFDLNHAELATLIMEARFSIFKRAVSTVDGLRRFELFHRRKIRVRTDMGNVDASL